MIRHTTLLFVLLAVGVGLTLFVVKVQVQDLEEELTALNRTLVKDQQKIHVLQAEWSHLNEPARLRDLAQRYLDVGPVESNQIVTPAGLKDRLSGELAPIENPAEPKIQPVSLGGGQP